MQGFIKDTAVNYLSKKLHTTVALNHLYIDFPSSIELDKFYMADQKGDTLVYSDSLKVGIDMLGLFSGHITIHNIKLKKLSCYVYRTLPDTIFNFNYILKAFASRTPAPPDTSGSTTVFTIHNIALSGIHVRYKDDVTGYDADVHLGTFKTNFKTFNLDKMRFDLDSILLTGIHADIRQSAPLLTDTSGATASSEAGRMPELSFSGLDLHRIFVRYDNTAAGLSGLLDMGQFQLIPHKIDLNQQVIDLKKLALNHTRITVSQYQGSVPPVADEKQPATDTTASSGNHWVFKLDQLRFADDDLKYDDASKPKAKKGIDYNHLAVSGLNISLDDGFYSADSSHAAIGNIALREKSGFDLRKLTTEAIYTSHGASLDKLDLQTAKSRITKRIAISYPSLDSIGKAPGTLGVQADLSGCVIDLNEVLYFQPSMDASPSMKKLMHSIIKIDGNIQGKLDDLEIKGLDMRTAGRTHLAVNAHLTGLPDMNKAVFNVDLKDFSSGSSDLYALLPAQTIPSSISIPPLFALRGTYKGSLNSFATQLSLTSSYGNLTARGKAGNLKDSLHGTYQAMIKTDRLDLGKLLKNDTMYGKLSLVAELKGTGMTKNSADAAVKGVIKQAQLKGYDYKNLAITGDYHHQAGHLNMEMQDPNLRFNLKSSADLAGRYPAVKLNLALDSVNLYALHLSPDSIKVRGKINADFPTADLDHLNGELLLSDLQMVKSDQRIDIDSVTLNAFANDTTDSLHLAAPFATANVSGHYKLSKAGDLIGSLVQHYFGKDSSTQALTDSAGNQLMRIKLTLSNHPLWQQILPSLRSFSGAVFSGELSSAPQSLQLKGNISQLILGTMTVDSMRLAVQSDTTKLNYALSLNHLYNGSLQIRKTMLSGNAAHDNLNIDLKVQDAAGKDKYHLAGALNLNQKTYKFSFNPDSLLLNYDKWQVPEDNYIVYQPVGITAHDLKVENNGQYLLLNSQNESPGAPLDVSFHHFKLETLTRIASTDTALVSGQLNGKIVGEDLLKTPVFTADLHLDSLAIKDQPVGNIALKVDNKLPGAYNVEIALTGDSNDLKITGTYYTQPQSKFDFNVAMGALSLSSAQAFTFGQVSGGSGVLTGNLHVHGTMDQPHINGQLTFKNAALNITKVNDYLRMPNERIVFDDRGIHFDHFTLIDSLNNKAYIDGDLLTSNFKHYKFALNLSARRFRILNAKQNQGQLYYGPVFIDAKAKISGDENLPKVDMNLKMDKKSILTVVLPGSTPAVESSEGIVEFVDASHLRDTVTLAVQSDTIQHSPLTGIDLSANISVDTAAILNLIIDPTNGDNLRVQGDATLNMTMDPSGKISLTGRYEITKGAYSMSLEGLIKRKFDIKKGSTITWTGNPTSANLDLTAIYHIQTSAMELVEDQLSGESETTKNTYKQKLPFDVNLNLKGELMKPDITFSLDMPESSRNAFNGSVYTRVNQINTSESEVNKQVLGLLVLGHFIADNPFQTTGGGGAEQMARQSASKILSQQLNNLAGNLVQGVDLNFDLQSSENYSTGKAENQTNLNVGVSKSLFNGRTSVYVGSNIQLEGPQQANQKSSQIAGDVSIEYKLSRDGRYRLRAYRQNKYEGIIEGQFIETGLNFIIVMDYNHFRELFHKKRRSRHKRM
ncbi:MAG TPA: translocation/assembly module TamB domain-containing protein [Chitinophagaceae bacterium]|nr:translocation/assembly module TamB domain-containing protein [Chitinophagaceae bacterium]